MEVILKNPQESNHTEDDYTYEYITVESTSEEGSKPNIAAPVPNTRKFSTVEARPAPDENNISPRTPEDLDDYSYEYITVESTSEEGSKPNKPGNVSTVNVKPAPENLSPKSNTILEKTPEVFDRKASTPSLPEENPLQTKEDLEVESTESVERIHSTDGSYEYVTVESESNEDLPPNTYRVQMTHNRSSISHKQILGNIHNIQSNNKAATDFSDKITQINDPHNGYYEDETVEYDGNTTLEDPVLSPADNLFKHFSNEAMVPSSSERYYKTVPGHIYEITKAKDLEKFKPSRDTVPAFMPATIHVNSSDIPDHIRERITEKMMNACQVSGNGCQINHGHTYASPEKGGGEESILRHKIVEDDATPATPTHSSIFKRDSTETPDNEIVSSFNEDVVNNYAPLDPEGLDPITYASVTEIQEESFEEGPYSKPIIITLASIKKAKPPVMSSGSIEERATEEYDLETASTEIKPVSDHTDDFDSILGSPQLLKSNSIESNTLKVTEESFEEPYSKPITIITLMKKPSGVIKVQSRDPAISEVPPTQTKVSPSQVKVSLTQAMASSARNSKPSEVIPTEGTKNFNSLIF